MFALTQEGRRIANEMAEHYNFSEGAVTALIFALTAGRGQQAQFNIPEFGGMGQWSSSGMLMIGDMFNHDLKARVARLCADLATAIKSAPLAEASRIHPDVGAQTQTQTQGFGDHIFSQGREIWPAELGRPSSSGGQNDFSYAFFPQAHRLAVRAGGALTIYDTGERMIVGFAQQQGDGDDFVFLTSDGPLRLDQLQKAKPWEAPPRREGEDSSPRASSADVFQQLEKLAELHKKGVLTDEEFSEKKTELLKRL